MRDFFISYTSADRQWAEWIAWQLEEAKFTVVIQAWDFRPGGNFVLDMQQAAADCERTIAVLSPDYLKSLYTQPEWAAAFAQDPTGSKKLLLPVRVHECELKGLLLPIVYIDLVGAFEDEEAKDRLLRGISRERAKPKTAPQFPGVANPVRTIIDKPRFPGALPPVWNVPRSPNPHFVGRDELLEEMRQTLLKGQAAALIALHGLGGIGKTQLAAEYAHVRHTDYEAVWWLRAENEVTLAEDLAALARALELPEGEAREVPVIVAAVLRWLNGNKGWLLVFDNADDPAVVRAYLPQNRHGHVLITSRDPNWRGMATPLAVETLDENAAARFLLERTGQSGAAAEAAAKKLAKELGELPLALEQAGAYCEATGKPLADYLRLFRQRQRELMQRGQPANYPATVTTTWEISFQAAQVVAPAAADLLNLCAFLAPEELPLAVLRNGAKHLPTTLATAVADELMFEDALASLRRYSLLNRRDDAVTLHRLVQSVTRNRLTEAGQQRWAGAAVNIVNDAFPNSGDDARTWPVCARLLSHAQFTANTAQALKIASPASGRLFNEIGIYFLGRAQYDAAVQSFDCSLSIVEAALGSINNEVAIRINNLGEALRNLGQFDKAHQCFERALSIHEEVFGPTHPAVAIDINNLGLLLQDLNRLEEARQCYERALSICESTLTADHPNLATAANNLGSVSRALGRLDEAHQCFERALQIDELAFGSDHPYIARDANNLGLLLQERGDRAGARRYYKRALRIFTAFLGEDHPNTVIVRMNLAALTQTSAQKRKRPTRKK